MAQDQDYDGIPNDADGCPSHYNPLQFDGDGDGVQEACDNCPGVYNPDQSNVDGDLLGDACDALPTAGGYPIVNMLSIPEPVRGNILVDGDRLFVPVRHDPDIGPGGAVLVYRWVGNQWIPEQRVTASDAVGDDRFGTSIDVHDDTLVVGATRAVTDNPPVVGAVYVFTRDATANQWVESAKLTIGHRLGVSVAIDQDTLVVGSPNFSVGTQSAHVFRRNAGNTWKYEQELLAPTPLYNFSRSVDVSGQTIAVASDEFRGMVSLLNSGTIVLYQKIGGTWQPVFTEGSLSYQGGLSLEGNELKASARRWINVRDLEFERIMKIFRRDGSGWQEIANGPPCDGSFLQWEDSIACVNRLSRKVEVYRPTHGGWELENTIFDPDMQPVLATHRSRLVVLDALAGEVRAYAPRRPSFARKRVVLAADQIAGAVHAIDPDTGTLIHSFLDIGGSYFNGIVPIDVNAALVADVQGDRIVAFDLLSGNVVETVAGPGIAAPVDIETIDQPLVGSGATMIATNFSSGQLTPFRLVPPLPGPLEVDGCASGIAGSALAEYFDGVYSYVRVYLSDQHRDRVLSVIPISFFAINNFCLEAPTPPPADEITHTFAGCGLDGPADILLLSDTTGFDPSPFLVSSFFSDEVLRFNPDGTCAPCVAAGTAGLDGPEGLFWSAPGRFGVVSKLSGQILEFDAETCEFVGELASGLPRPTYATMATVEDFDCNGNSIPDTWDIQDGTSPDTNKDGVPDECQQVLVGDLNCDGVVSVGDINPFVLALTDPTAYADQFPDCDINAADCTGDQQVTVGDINCFVALVTGG